MQKYGYQLILAGASLFLFLVTFLNRNQFTVPTAPVDPDKLPVHSQVIRPGQSSQDFLFCFWNVENLFDDQNDGRSGEGDAEFDPWMANNPNLLNFRLSKLTEAILSLNQGKGPDILALCEVESVRAGELLKSALNQRLGDPKLHYQPVLMKEVSAGRHIAPCVLTRLPAVRDRTELLDRRNRILKTHLTSNNQELIVIASHWTSRLTNKDGASRQKYADLIYGATNAIWKANPRADVLICGDFNDSPFDESVAKNLHATGDIQLVKNPSQLNLLNLFAGKNPAAGFGTMFYKQWYIFDQIVVTPGMLDQVGWSCVPASVQTVNRLVHPNDREQKPWRFGGKNDPDGSRGYSDHFPVTVQLRVH